MKITEVITENTQGVREGWKKGALAGGIVGGAIGGIPGAMIGTGIGAGLQHGWTKEDEKIKKTDFLELDDETFFKKHKISKRDFYNNLRVKEEKKLDKQDVQEGQLDPYRLERLDPQSRRVLQRMADHAEPGSWLSASEAYAIMLGLQHKRQDPRGWEQEVQHYVDLWREITKD